MAPSEVWGSWLLDWLLRLAAAVGKFHEKMQQLAAALSKRKRFLILATALAAGGYASYSYYMSESFQRRKKQVILLVDGVSKLLQVVASLSDSAALISGEFREFLHSDNSEIPQSIKQLFKILRCPEFQDVLVSSSSRICKEIVYSVTSQAHQNAKKFQRSSSTPVKNNSTATIARGRIAGKYVPGQQPSSESSDGWKRERLDNFQATKAFLQGGSSSSSRSRSARQQEGLPERLLNKLFSDAGKGFASVVVGSAVRNLVISFFEEYQCNSNESELVPETEVFRATNRRCGGFIGAWKPENLLNLASSTKGKALIAECIQHFVEASVSTYLEKTRDINVFEEMVEAVTKPVHQVPAKEMIVTVCNGAVDTLVRTSYEVLHEAPSPSSTNDDEEIVISKLGRRRRSRSSENLIEKCFRALTVPSNRTLVIDLAGKVTSEAIRSFVNVFITICTPYVRSSQNAAHAKVLVVKNRVSGDAVARALILITVILAIFLHIVSNNR